MPDALSQRDPGRLGWWRRGIDVEIGDSQLRLRAEHGNPVAGADRVVATWAEGHLATLLGDDRHRGQRAEAITEALGLNFAELGHRGQDDVEAPALELERVALAAQADLDEGRRRDGGGVQHDPGRDDGTQGLADGRILHLDDESHVPAQASYLQRDLERGPLIGVSADDGCGSVDASRAEALGQVTGVVEVGHSPAGEALGMALVGIVIDHDHLGTTQVEQLDDSKTHALEAADDDVVPQRCDVHLCAGRLRHGHHSRARVPVARPYRRKLRASAPSLARGRRVAGHPAPEPWCCLTRPHASRGPAPLGADRPLRNRPRPRRDPSLCRGDKGPAP